VATRFNSAQQILDKNAELAARLKVQEHAAAERLARLEAENRQLKEDNERLKSENSRYCESNVLLKEEVQWLKAQVFGRSSEKSSSEVSPDQRMLFNEAEVLAAIEAADTADANRTTSIKTHERRHTGGRKALPKNFPRKRIPHDIADS
jgi:hypothetical protein